MRRLVGLFGSAIIALTLGSPAFAGHGKRGNGESMKGGLPALEDRVEADEALIQALQGQNNWAVVDANGNLIRSNSSAGPVSVQPHTAGSGLYEVDFSMDVSACAYVATLGDTGTATPPVGLIGVTGASSPDGVIVQTSSSGGTPADAAFHLLVTCP